MGLLCPTRKSPSKPLTELTWQTRRKVVLRVCCAGGSARPELCSHSHEGLFSPYHPKFLVCPFLMWVPREDAETRGGPSWAIWVVFSRPAVLSYSITCPLWEDGSCLGLSAMVQSCRGF